MNARTQQISWNQMKRVIGTNDYRLVSRLVRSRCGGLLIGSGIGTSCTVIDFAPVSDRDPADIHQPCTPCSPALD